MGKPLAMESPSSPVTGQDKADGLEDQDLSRAFLSGLPALRAVRNFVKRHGLLRSLMTLVMIAAVLCALFAEFLAPHSPTEIGYDVLQAPSWDYLLGTDHLGRDVLSRVIFGARPALLTAGLAVAVGIAIGVSVGLFAGYGSRKLGSAIMRLVDIMLALPGLVMAMVVMVIMGSGLKSIVTAIALAQIPVFARMVYGETLSVKRRAFIDSARVLGFSDLRIVGVHILPNIASQVAVLATAALGWSILVAATLNFLGFGISPPNASWGVDLQYGRQWVYQAWWLSVMPGAAIALVIMSSNLLGDVVADSAGRGSRIEGAKFKADAVI
ncbi:MAG: hypothetical protein CL467_05705 [Acidimicrobiaceae bacterium]|nr:hypothetical protein [Acidimicrobiaceae bacterium]